MSRIFNIPIFLHISLLVTLIIASFTIHADWMNLTGAEISENIAEIYVLDDYVRVKLEVYVGDLDKFEDLVPDEWLKDSVTERPSLEQRMHTFATERLQFVTDKGVKLPAKLELIEPRERVDRVSPYAGMINPMTRQRVREAPEDKRVLYAEVIYPFPGEDKIEKPESLQIIPPLDEQGIVMVNIGFVAYHHAVPVTDFRYLGQPAKLNLDWQDPWYSKFDNKNLTRHHKYPLMLYLYVEPRQVRLESLLRVSDISEITGFDVDKSRLNVADKHQQLQEHIKDYYTGKGSLQIDGQAFKPDSIRVEFLTVSLTGLKVTENVSAVDESSLLVGVSQQFLRESLPQQVESSWPFFNQRIDRIPVIATDPAGPFLTLIDKEDPGFGWQNFLKTYTEPVIQPVEVKTGWRVDVPYIGDVKILDQLPDEQQASSIVNGVFENVRVVFIEKRPDNFTHQLTRVSTADADKVDILGKELAKLFSPKVTGGGVSSVQSFDELQVSDIRETDDASGFRANISGSATIAAKHWGHIDQRQFQFQLLLDLSEVIGDWRLADLTVIDIKEVK